MVEIRRSSLTAVVLLVLLRLGLGWQLLYEGLWKVDTFSTSTPWSSDGYLKNSQGPLRPLFRWMAGDPNDMSWLKEDIVAKRWDAWRERFEKHYGLDRGQVARLGQLVDGSSLFVAPLSSLPEAVDFRALRLDGVISFDAETKQLRVDGQKHLLASEKQSLEDQVAGLEGEAYDDYRKSLDDVFNRAARLSYKERLRAHLLGNPDNFVKRDDEKIKTSKNDGRISQIELYEKMISRYEDRLAKAKVEFQLDHVDRIWSDARAKGRELAGPVIAMDAELRQEAEGLLTVEQLAKGPPSEPWTRLKVVDTLTITGLIGLGILLIVGLFTRFAALAAAVMVFGFYMALPPLPGVPEAPGPEHSFIVNKNLIEVMALLALSSVPTGHWFGLDKLISSFVSRRHGTAAKQQAR